KLEADQRQDQGEVGSAHRRRSCPDQRQARPARRQDPAALWLGQRHGAQRRRRLAEGARQSRVRTRGTARRARQRGRAFAPVLAPFLGTCLAASSLSLNTTERGRVSMSASPDRPVSEPTDPPTLVATHPAITSV